MRVLILPVTAMVFSFISCSSGGVVVGDNGQPKSSAEGLPPSASGKAACPKNMVFVEGGTFMMGDLDGEGWEDERPIHLVSLDDFCIGKHSITQREWYDVMGSTVEQQRIKAGYLHLYGLGDNYPMYYVSWNEAVEFVKKLSEKSGINYRLPTEAEWEFAARGGNSSKGYKYAGSNNIDEVAWYSGNSDYLTHEVCKKKANELGICDMSGNVWDWVSDRYGSYSPNPQTNPQGSLTGSSRISRGGSWSYGAQFSRVAFRDDFSANIRYDNFGFRLALTP